MDHVGRHSSQDLTRSRSLNSFLESEAQLPPLYNRPAHLPHQQSFSALLRPRTSRHPSKISQTVPGTPELTSDEGSDAGYFSTFSGPGYLKPSIVPTYEYYGFVLYLSSTVIFGLYLIWGLLGPETLEQYIGDLGYPARWWAFALPAWAIVCLIYIYIALACYNTQVLTPAFNDPRTITDRHAKLCTSRDSDKWDHGTDAVLDLPLSTVCHALYNDDVGNTAEE